VEQSFILTAPDPQWTGRLKSRQTAQILAYFSRFPAPVAQTARLGTRLPQRHGASRILKAAKPLALAGVDQPG
jgi:hypothetical protein